MNRTTRGWLASLFLILAACEEAASGPGDESPRLVNAPAPGQSPVDRPHVLFTVSRMVIPRLGVPTRPPASLTSTLGPETLRSEDPSIVSVTRDGMLLGLRTGRARVRSIPDQEPLDVEVRSLDAIALTPGHLTLEPGRSARLALFDPATNEPLPAAEAEWVSDGPGIATVREGRIDAGGLPGSATVRVRYAGFEVRAEVTVSPQDTGLALTPARARMRPGEVRLFQLGSRAGPQAGAWESRNPAVVALVRDGLVQARGFGRTTICATAQGRRACSNVEVSP